MINSRQIVDLIKDKMNNTSAETRDVLNDIISDIKILEKDEMSEMYKDFLNKQEAEKKASRERIEQLAKDFFK